MAFIRTGFEFRVGLGCDEPRMGIQFDHFNNSAVRGNTAEAHTVFDQFLAIVVINFIAVTMALFNFTGAVELVGFGIRVENTFVSAESQSAAQISDSVLIRHNMDKRMGCRRI